MRTLVVAALALFAIPAAAQAAELVDITPLGRTPAQGNTQAEIAAFHAKTDRAFATNAGENRLDIYNFSNPAAPTLIEEVELAPYGGGPNSVDVTRNGLVAVAVQADDHTDPGSVEFFTVDGDHICGVPVGALPDMLTFTEDEKRLLVANEGEPSADGLTDPEGSVSVLDLRQSTCGAVVRTAGFKTVPLHNAPRIVTPGNSAPQDFEPEYIAVAGGLAYVTIQEANAVGVLDIKNARFQYVRGLGYKDHGLSRNALDPSDEDGIDIDSWKNVFGMYQPDAIAAYLVNNRRFLVTANEGDVRENDVIEEGERVEDLALDPAAFPADATDEDNLGRLTVTSTQGDTDDDGDYDRLFSFGARSMSVLRDNATVNYDTGRELERFVAMTDPSTFNANHSLTPVVDNRSDDKGPEPEAVAVGAVDGTMYAFLGSERQGGIHAYDLSADPGKAQLAGYVNTRPADRGPEGALFVPAVDSPTGAPLLLITYEITGTVAAYELQPATNPQ